jgi:hypothetical protein
MWGAAGLVFALEIVRDFDAEVAPEVAPASEEVRRTGTAGGEKPEPSRDDAEDGRYWDRTSGPRLVRAMLSR